MGAGLGGLGLGGLGLGKCAGRGLTLGDGAHGGVDLGVHVEVDRVEIELQGDPVVGMGVGRHLRVLRFAWEGFALRAATLHLHHVAAVRALFDLPGDAVPIGAHRRPTLEERLKAEALHGVVRLAPTHLAEDALELLAEPQGRDPLDALEPLFVACLQTLEARLGVVEDDLELRLGHYPRSSTIFTTA